MADSVKFLTGAALGLAMHEGGHLVFDTIFDASPRIKGVRFGPLPFFAITHRGDLSPRRVHDLLGRILMVDLVERVVADQTRPLREGTRCSRSVLAFNVLNPPATPAWRCPAT